MQPLKTKAMKSVTNKTVSESILSNLHGCASIDDLSKLLSSQPVQGNGFAFKVVRHCQNFEWYGETFEDLENAKNFVKHVAESYA